MIQSLSPRERQLYHLLLRSGKGNKQIAAEMGVSDGTTKIYAAEIYKKLGIAGGRIELMTREILTLDKLIAQESA